STVEYLDVPRRICGPAIRWRVTTLRGDGRRRQERSRHCLRTRTKRQRLDGDGPLFTLLKEQLYRWQYTVRRPCAGRERQHLRINGRWRQAEQGCCFRTFPVRRNL